ncbi:hypothetical protein CW357_00825 [Rummeliibacillus sp. TYF005]|uniref:hypothetical protein n=1 Tax=Rummeliibacillus sp. TYF005 TaxID=2058214 RepID=UPI000F537242|nr:hypothetical protein [Rummeliibacillus sp. TYF005]RPJ97246.1 hypothetical protein CW357_00825 [Rummeliibacillus sp. TYF005]
MSTAKTLSIETMKKIAEERGGWCLSDNYINQLTKLTWKCSEGHIWETTPKTIRKGAWCPFCARQWKNRKRLPSLDIETVKLLAKRYGGECLSKEYTNKNTKLTFKCKEGHIFKLAPAYLQRGGWCAYCIGRYKNSIDSMREIAEKHGGMCLSKSYKNVFTKLKWKCANGHIFEAIPKHIVNGHWCPNCTLYLNEQRCRYILETLLDVKFIKDHNILNGFELDGYNDDLKLAFEYHGKQHFEQVDFFYSRGDMSLNDRMERDKLKEKRCKELGIDLIIIPYTVEPEEHITFIANELTKRGFQFKINPNDINFENYSFTNQSLKEVQDIAESNGGRCLSTVYINADSKMNFVCKNGHEFKMTPYNLKIGRWCRECFYIERAGASQRLDSNEMYRVAKEKGWECLSTDYKNARTKLIWKCEKGHIFERTLAHVKEGRGCPNCNKRKK